MGKEEKLLSPNCLSNSVDSSVIEMVNRIGTSREREINFVIQWTAAKATVAMLFIAIGLIFSNTRAVLIGAAFGGIGLIGLGNLIAWVGFYSTIGRFQVFFQGISRNFKRTFGKIRIRQNQRKTVFSLKLTEEGVFRVFEMPNAPDFLRKTTDFFLSYNEWPKKGVPLLVESINPEMENDQLKAVTIELGTISVWRVLVFRIRYFAWRFVEAIRNISRKDR